MSYSDENTSARQSASSSPLAHRKICIHDAITNLGPGLDARRQQARPERYMPHTPAAPKPAHHAIRSKPAASKVAALDGHALPLLGRRRAIAETYTEPSPAPRDKTGPSLPDVVGLKCVGISRGLPAGKPKTMDITTMCRIMGGADSASPIDQEFARITTSAMPPNALIPKNVPPRLPPLLPDYEDAGGNQGRDCDTHGHVPRAPKGPKTGKFRRRVGGRKPH